MFELEAIRQTYGGTAVLDLARFAGSNGERWLVLGRSGSGKTTLLHLMAGVLRPSAGRVRIAGRDLAELRGAELDRFRGATIGIVFQQLHLIPTLTVAQNLELARFLAGVGADRARVRSVLEDLGLGERRDAYPDELSQGQQQRAAIGRAVVNGPRLILADEPTSALDDANAAAVATLLRAQAERHGATLVVATHDRRIAGDFAHRLDLDDAATAKGPAS